MSILLASIVAFTSALLLTMFTTPQVHAGGAWEINKKSSTLTCSNVTVTGTTNAPFVRIKVSTSNGTQKLLVSSFVNTSGDTTNAQTQPFKISTKFSPQPNGTQIRVQIFGYYLQNDSGQVNAPPITLTTNCVDPNASPSPSPTIAPMPTPQVSPSPLASPTPQPTPAPQAQSWFAKIWHWLTSLFKH